VGGHLGVERHGGAEDGDVALVAGHDRGLATHGQRAYEGGGIDHGDFLVVALVLGPPRDVLHAAVAVVGINGELLLVVPRQDAVLGEGGDLRDGGVVLGAEGGAGGDPAADEAILVGVDFQALAAAVRDAAGGLLEQEAAVGRRREDAPAAALLDQRHVVELG